jgi:hypothetical protein
MESAPAEFDPNPVHPFAVTFGGWIPPIRSVRDAKNFRTASLCRGTPLVIRTGVLADRVQATFDLGPIGTEAPPAKQPPTEETTLRFKTD